MKTIELKDKIANGEDSFTHFKEQIYPLIHNLSIDEKS